MDRFEALEIDGIELKKEKLEESQKPLCFNFYLVPYDSQCSPECEWRELCTSYSQRVSKSIAPTNGTELHESVDTCVLRDGRDGYLCAHYGIGYNILYVTCGQCFNNKRGAYTTCSWLTRGKLEPSKSTQQERVLGTSFNGMPLSSEVLEEARSCPLQRAATTHNVDCPLYGTDYEANDPSCLECSVSRPCNFHTNSPRHISVETQEVRVRRPFMSYGLVKALLIFVGGSVILALLLSSLLRG